MLHSNFVIAGTLLGAMGTIVYLVATVKGKVKPNRVSFLLWSLVPFIAFSAQIDQGVGLEALMTFSTGFLPLLVFFASFVNKEAEWKITVFDLFCGALSLAGLGLWAITREGNVAILLSIVADTFAAIPTLVKAYRFPETEIGWPWLTTSAGVVLTLLTLQTFTFANSGFIIYILVLNLLIYMLVQFRLGEKIQPIISRLH